MKKIFKIALILSLIVTIVIPIGADTQAKGTNTPQSPIIKNGTTLVPMRGIFEALGANVSWNGENKSIYATDGSKEIFLKIGNNVATVDGKEIILNQPAVLINGATMVPLRFVSESLGADVSWDNLTRTVSIRTDQINSEFYYYITEEPDLSNVNVYRGSEYGILTNINEGLFRLGPNQEIQNALAEDYTVSEDGRIWTFNIRDAKWSNGEAITAQDFVDGWEYSLNYMYSKEHVDLMFFEVQGASAYRNYTKYVVLKDLYDNDRNKYYEHIAKYEIKDGTTPTPSEICYGEEIENPQPVFFDSVGIKAVDDKTLEIRLYYTWIGFLEFLTHPSTMPINKKFLEEKEDNYGKEADKMLYSGPFKITTWVHNEKIVFEKNENYWDEENVKLDKVVMSIVDDGIDTYNNGLTDILYLNYDNILLYKNNHAYSEELKYDVKPKVDYLEFNNNNSVLNNKNIRKALSLSIDRQKYSELYRFQIPATGYIPPGIPGIGETSFREQNDDLMEYDLEEAKKYLEIGLLELGLDELPELRYLGYTKEYEFYRDSFAKIGVNLEHEKVDSYKAFYKKLYAKEFDLVENEYKGFNLDPRGFLFNFSSKSSFNNGKWVNYEYDKIMSSTLYMQDYNARTEQYLTAEKLLLDEAAIAPLVYEVNYRLTKPYIKGFVTHPVRDYSSWKWMYIEDKEMKLK